LAADSPIAPVGDVEEREFWDLKRRFNYRSEAKEAWIIECGTSGALYFSLADIQIPIRLTQRQLGQVAAAPRGKILLRATKEDDVSVVIETSTAMQFIQVSKEPPVWQMSIRRAFPPSLLASYSMPRIMGQFRLEVEMHLDKEGEPVFKAKDMIVNVIDRSSLK
jgi:hypothetical protein